MLVTWGDSQGQDGQEVVREVHCMLDYVLLALFQQINIPLFGHYDFSLPVFTYGCPAARYNVDTYHQQQISYLSNLVTANPCKGDEDNEC